MIASQIEGGNQRVGLAILGSGEHKYSHIAPMIRDSGVEPFFTRLANDLPETESHSPRDVLADKLATFSHIGFGLLHWMTDLDFPIDAIAVMDLLGLQLQPNERFDNATRILTKPDIGSDIHAAADHFEVLSHSELTDGHHWMALVPGAGLAPYNKKNHSADLRHTKTVWDSAMYLGYSHALTKLLSNTDNISLLIEEGMLCPQALSVRSIGGVKNEKILQYAIPLAVQRPKDGLSMAVIYQKRRWLFDKKADLNMVGEAIQLVDGIAANASVELARQMANTTFKFAGIDSRRN